MNPGRTLAGSVSDTNRSGTKAQPMRILLRNCKTGQYFRSADKWTNNRLDAASFETSTQAVYLIIKREMRDMEVLLASEEIPCDIRLPVTLPKLTLSEVNRGAAGK